MLFEACLVLSVLFVCGERAGAVCLLCDLSARRVLSQSACIVNVVAGGAAVGGGKQGD